MMHTYYYTKNVYIIIINYTVFCYISIGYEDAFLLPQSS
jgi:hypothetical protein